MRERPPLDGAAVTAVAAAESSADARRLSALFRRVGARWLWFSRLVMDDAELEAIIHDPAVELFVVEQDGERQSACSSSISAKRGECELAFVGLVPELAGQGHGRWLLAEALELRLARRGGAGPRPHLHARPSGGACRLSPRRLHAVQARDRALPRPAPARPPAARLRASGAAARDRNLGFLTAGQLQRRSARASRC